MKNYFFIILIGMTTSLFAQQNENEEFKSAIKLNLLSPFYNALSISYEYKYENDKSFQIGLGFMDYETGNKGENEGLENTQAFIFTPEIRYDISNQLIEKLYIAGFTRLISMNYTNQKLAYSYDYVTRVNLQTLQTKEASYISLGIGILFGKQYVIKNRLLIDGFVGPVYGFLLQKDIDDKYSNKTYGRNDMLTHSTVFFSEMLRKYSFRGGLTIGWKF
jgi:hypothetical protein